MYDQEVSLEYFYFTGIFLKLLIYFLHLCLFSGEDLGASVAIEDCTSQVWDFVFQQIFNDIGDFFDEIQLDQV